MDRVGGKNQCEGNEANVFVKMKMPVTKQNTTVLCNYNCVLSE